jgi:chemotaxis family two-component system sensor kinase Cph1
VREGKLWGLIAAHHYSPRHLRLARCAAAARPAGRSGVDPHRGHRELCPCAGGADGAPARAAADRGHLHRGRLAAGAVPQPAHPAAAGLEATGAALFHGGEILTTGEVPSTPELRALCCNGSTGRPNMTPCSPARRWASANPSLASLTPTASGVLAVKLSTNRPDYLMWFRKEQLLTVTWAGDPYQADGRQRPAAAVAAALFRGLVRDRARHRAALDPSELAMAAPSAWRWWTSSCRCMRCGC